MTSQSWSAAAAYLTTPPTPGPADNPVYPQTTNPTLTPAPSQPLSSLRGYFWPSWGGLLAGWTRWRRTELGLAARQPIAASGQHLVLLH